MDPFDPKRFRSSGPSAVAATSAKAKPKTPSRAKGSEYLGAVNWGWLSAASKLPGKAMHVGLVLWHLHHLRRRWTVRWEPIKAASLGITRYAAYAGLRRLEAAGLITVDRHVGRCPIVTILDQQKGG